MGSLNPNPNPALGDNLNDPPAPSEQEVLQRAVAKLVLLGEHAGVTPDKMIALLESGLTVAELLEYIALGKDESS